MEICRPTQQSPVTTSSIPGLDDELALAEATEAFVRAVQRTLEMTGGSQTESARRLDLPQSNLSRLMKRLRLR